MTFRSLAALAAGLVVFATNGASSQTLPPRR